MKRNWLDLVFHIAALESRYGRLRVLAERTADTEMIESLKRELEGQCTRSRLAS